MTECECANGKKRSVLVCSCFAHVKVTDLGIEKAKDVRASDEQVQKVVAKAKEVLAAQK